MIELKQYIADQWVDPALTLERELFDASTGERLGPQVGASQEQILTAIEAADQNHQQKLWAQLSLQQKADKLLAISNAIAKHTDAIARADSIQTGVVINLTEKLSQLCVAAFKVAADLVLNPPQQANFKNDHGDLIIERLPLGPAAIVAPWNAPSGISCHKLASALAAGCPVILKPSEWAAFSSQIIAEAIATVDLPAGTFQMVHGDAACGKPLVTDNRIKAVSFTGGLRGGRAIGTACAQDIKPAQLELGGNNALVVLSDANLDAAAAGVVQALTTLNGQWCRALGRLLVHESCLGSLLKKIEQELQQVKIGSALETGSEMGPIVHPGHLDHLQTAVGQFEAMGGQAHRFGELPERLEGWFMQPTFVTGLKPEDTLEEVFGPVAVVHTFQSDEEAIALANQTPYGLAAYVFGEQQHAIEIARSVEAGGIKINAVTLLNLHPMAPRPAWGLSGLGDEGTVETFEFFRGSRVIGIAAQP